MSLTKKDEYYWVKVDPEIDQPVSIQKPTEEDLKKYKTVLNKCEVYTKDRSRPRVDYSGKSAPTSGQIPIPADPVYHPSHYSDDSMRGDKSSIECIDAIRASMSPDEFGAFCKGNIMKYLWRFEHKGGLEDLNKAQVYLTWLINTLKGEDLKK